MATQIKVEFTTEAERRFLSHKGDFIGLDTSGTGRFEAEENEWDLIQFGIQGSPGDTATITLTAPVGTVLEIAGHPIQGRIAQGKVVWGDSRFFRLRRSAS